MAKAATATKTTPIRAIERIGTREPEAPDGAHARRARNGTQRAASTPGPGRPTKATTIRIRAILAALRYGTPRRIAAQAAGVGESTLLRWIAENQEFRERVEIAEAQAVTTRLRRIDKAGRAGVWQADMTVLERRYPSDFGRQVRLDVNVYQAVRAEAARIAAELGISIDDVLTGSGVADSLPSGVVEGEYREATG
jgi:transposase